MPKRTVLCLSFGVILFGSGCSTEPCPVDGNYGLVVEVRTLAGAPAAEGATAEADGEETVVQLERRNELTFVGVDQPGTYRLTVTKPGYLPAVEEGIRVTGDGCDVETTTVLINLLPE